MKRRLRLISSEQATPAKKQHTKPCSDWARTALAGWLGSNSVEEWIAMAHGETYVECHVHPNVQCAGVAIYRANSCKLPRDPRQLVLKRDTTRVFGRAQEFRDHHHQEPRARSKPGGKPMSTFQEDADDIINQIEGITAPRNMEQQEAIEWLRDLCSRIETMIGGIQSDLERG